MTKRRAEPDLHAGGWDVDTPGEMTMRRAKPDLRASPQVTPDRRALNLPGHGDNISACPTIFDGAKKVRPTSLR